MIKKIHGISGKGTLATGVMQILQTFECNSLDQYQIIK